jgi:hypothetical protein
MQQNSGNTYSLVYVYRTTSNNQITLNTEMTLRKRKKKRRKSKTDDKLACCPHNNPLQLLISTRDPLLTFCRRRDSRRMSPSGHPIDNTERVHTQLDYTVKHQHYSHAHAATYEGVLECICVVWMSWTDLSVAERVHKQE